MSLHNADLFKELHQLVLESNLSQTRAMMIINDHIEKRNLQIAKLNNQNMVTHFSNHISLSDRMANEVLKTTATKDQALVDVDPEVGEYVEDMVRRKLGNDVNDYLQLDRIRAMLMEKLEVLDGVVIESELDGSTKVDYEAMPHYVTMIREIRKCIVDVNKIRQSKQLISLIIKSLVEKNTLDIVRQMAREHEQIMKDLLDDGVPDTVVQKTRMKLGMRLAEVVAVTARNAVTDIMRSYKLD
jgi:hypothetical protein